MSYQPTYFKEAEFARCSPACKMSDLSDTLLHKLDAARELCGFPFIVNSAYRTVEYEKSKGRKGTSSHTKGLAVDLRCGSSYIRFRMVQALVQVGFCRIGLYPTFIHADLDDSKVSAIWLDETDICWG